MGKALIVGAAPEVYWDGRETPELIVCADGGLEAALRLGLRPDIWIGDGDSWGGEAPRESRNLLLPPDKDLTDLHACVRAAMAEGFREITMIGVTGGRLDHFLSAVGLLECIDRQGGAGRIVDKHNEILYLKETEILRPPHRYRYFSLIPLDEEVTLSVSGARYPLDKKILRRDDSLGVSNRPSGEGETVIRLWSGRALLVKSGLIMDSFSFS